MTKLFLTAEQHDAIDYHESADLFIRQYRDEPQTVYIHAEPHELYFDRLNIPHTVRPGILGGSIVMLTD